MRQSIVDPATADIEGFSLDALMSPDRSLTGLQFQSGVSERQPVCGPLNNPSILLRNMVSQRNDFLGPEHLPCCPTHHRDDFPLNVQTVIAPSGGFTVAAMS